MNKHIQKSFISIGKKQHEIKKELFESVKSFDFIMMYYHARKLLNINNSNTEKLEAYTQIDYTKINKLSKVTYE